MPDCFRFIGIKLTFSGPPPWSCMVWIPQPNDPIGSDEGRQMIVNRVINDVVKTVGVVSPEQIDGLVVHTGVMATF